MPQPRRRSYDEGCIAAHALNLIGDRWALLLVRELLLGPRRFSDLRGGLPGISANVLTQRLAEAERQGLLRRAGRDYRLTAAGQGLWPVIRALALWGAAQPGHDPARFISPAALMLSMRATCDRARAGPHRAVMRAGGEAFVMTTAPGHLHVARIAMTADAAPGLLFQGTTNALAAAIYGPRPLAETAPGLITFGGDPAEGQAFLNLFSLPGHSKARGGSEGDGPEPDGPDTDGPESDGPESDGPESERPDTDGPDSRGLQGQGPAGDDFATPAPARTAPRGPEGAGAAG